MKKLHTQEVFDKLKVELEYQDLTAANYEHNGCPSFETEILLMEEYLANARTAWLSNKGNTMALDYLRKVAGIAVRCFKNHGCPDRYIDSLRPLVKQCVVPEEVNIAVHDKSEVLSSSETIYSDFSLNPAFRMVCEGECFICKSK